MENNSFSKSLSKLQMVTQSLDRKILQINADLAVDSKTRTKKTIFSRFLGWLTS